MNRVHIRNLQKTIPVNRSLLAEIVRSVCSQEAPGVQYQIGVRLVNNEAIRDLNRRFHHRDTATDVLAFVLSDRTDEIVADIVISAETAVSQSRIFRTNPRYELYLYAIHGLLHCTGYDDRTGRDRAVMRRMEKKYLNMFHISQE